MRNVMKKAWEIARNGQKKFGGKVREYFAIALKMTWNIVKKAMEMVQLKGSEKQVAWANDLRKVVKTALETAKALNPAKGDERFDLAVKYIEENVLAQDSAKYFIDRFQEVDARRLKKLLQADAEPYLVAMWVSNIFSDVHFGQFMREAARKNGTPFSIGFKIIERALDRTTEMEQLLTQIKKAIL